MTTPTPTLREALEDADAAITALLGYCSDQTSTAKDAIATLEAIRAALAAQPELPEPVAHIAINSYGGRETVWHDAKTAETMPEGTKLYTAAQLQQAQAKREPMSGGDLQSAYEASDTEPDARYAFVLGCRAAEAHHHIGDKV